MSFDGNVDTKVLDELLFFDVTKSNSVVGEEEIVRFRFGSFVKEQLLFESNFFSARWAADFKDQFDA
jgi:hypothetical protein